MTTQGLRYTLVALALAALVASAGVAFLDAGYRDAVLAGAGIGVAVLLISPLIAKLMHLDLMKTPDPALAGRDMLAEPAAAGTRTEGEYKA